MKKNIMMRLSAVLLVAVLLSLCVISGTWAKYVTSKNADETATVAKWGVNVEVSGVDNKEYKVDFSAEEAVGTISAATDAKLLAPGAGVKFCSFTVTGTPEVAVSVEYTATLTLTGWEIGDPAAEYCPLVFTVNGTPYAIDALNEDMDEISELVAAVEAAITGLSAEYAANTNLNTNHDLVVTCSWAFEGNNENDTALGNLADSPTVQLVVGCSVTQLDEYTPAP